MAPSFSPSGNLQKDLFAGVVTSLCFYGERIVLVGHGPYLKAYNVVTGALLACREVLPDNRIHRITLAPHSQTSTEKETRKIAVYGAKYITFLEIMANDDDIHIEIIESVGPFCDWIMDLQWLKREGQEEYNQLAIAYAHNFVQVYDMVTTTSTSVCLELVHEIQCEVRCILYSARFYGEHLSDLILASGTVFNQVHVWKVNERKQDGDGQVFRELIGHEGVIFGVRFSPDGSMLVSVSDDRTIRVWSMKNVKQRPLVVFGHTARVWDCQFVDEYLVSISEDATCRVWKNGLIANDSDSNSIGDDKGIDLGDTSMDCLACWEGHTGKNIWSCAISPDHKIVATGGQDSGVRLWSLTSIKENNIDSEDDLICMRLPEEHKSDMIRNFSLVDHKTYIASTDHGHLIQFDVSAHIPDWQDAYQDDGLRGYSIVQQSTCGRLLVAGSMAGGLLFYSAKNEFKHLKMDVHTQKIFEIFIIASKVSPSLFYVISYAYNGDIYFHRLDVSDGSKPTVNTPYMLKLPTFRTTPISMALEESKGLLISGSRESTMLIYLLPDFDNISHDRKSPVYSDIQVQRTHGKQCLSSITFKPSSAKTHTSSHETNDDEYVTFWTTGRDGCYMEYRLKLTSATVTRDDGAMHVDSQDNSTMSKNGNLLLEKVYRNKVTKGWLEGAVYIDDQLLLLGFYRKSFFVYNETKHFEMVSIACGGAHRRWHFNTLDARLDHASFAFIRKEAIYAYIRDGNSAANGFQESTLQSNYHGREVRALKYLELPANIRQGNQPVIFATGGEDTILRIHQYIADENGPRLTTHSTIRKHKSVIKCIEWSIGNEILVFTAGGTEEFRCWKLEMYDDTDLGTLVVNCLEWATCPNVSDDRIETRIMDLTTVVIDPTLGLHLIGAVYSDATIRIWLLDEKTRKFSLLVDGTWHAKCILQISSVTLEQGNGQKRILFFTSATDGKVAMWDISNELYSVLSNMNLEIDPLNPAVKFSEPLAFYQLHMSGVNALKVIDFDKDSLLVLTGGEDNAITATLVNKSNGKMLDNGSCIIANAHASSVTGLFVDSDSGNGDITVATVSIDQRLNIWSLRTGRGTPSLQLELVDAIFVDVPDPSALDGRRLKNDLHLTLTGIGLQNIRFVS